MSSKPQSEMMEYKSSIEAYFKEHPPANIKEAMVKIEDLTGIHRSENRVREFVESIGLKRRKIGMIPAKAYPELQEGQTEIQCTRGTECNHSL